MKYSQILKANSDLAKSLPDEKFEILVLSNIITSQLNEILEYTLRINDTPAIVKSGNYDNIVQDSLKYNDSNTVIIFWEICNIIDGFQFKHNILFKNDNIFKILKFKKFKLISYSPLAEGLLTGKYLKKTKFGRIVEATKKKNYYKSLLSKKNKIIITKLYNACNKNFYTLTRKSYRFLLKDYRISNILIGVSSFKQLSKNISIINKIN